MGRDRVWSPPQGGLPPGERTPGAVVEIACDESGFSGTNLLDPATPVITHASVDLTPGEAVTLITTLRSGFRYAPSELKSGQFLRNPKAREALEWFLTELRGRAHVHVIDKSAFLTARIADLFLAEPTYAAGTRLARSHRPGGAASPALLAAFVALVRTKHRHQPDPRLFEEFFRIRDGLGGVYRDLDRAHVWQVLTRLMADDRTIPPPLEPLLPALAETVLFWSGGGRRVLVIHDEQSALTADRLRRLQLALADGDRPSPLAGLISVDSRDDARVQLADLLAGVARRLSASTGDAESLLASLEDSTSRGFS